MAREFELIPKRVPRVETPFRRIVTELPVPESLPVLERLYQYEPVAMRGQPPVVWDHAEGFQVYDAYGNLTQTVSYGTNGASNTERPLLTFTHNACLACLARRV
jgi:hypothetical protein